MTDIDDVADSLAATQGSLDDLPVVAVRVDDPMVTVVLGLPSGDRFEEALTIPPVWGMNCRLKTLLDAYDLALDDVEDLEGETVPCTRSVEGSGLSFGLDLDSLAET
ncbi:hypothetical protein ACFPYI_21210 [Halomarina salina]|uniref:Halobacterial output domain-containing protein n=1 Tax=Halomarina salina TaxID=1872699 RepID=A0ABD5RTF5_9EURY|nr:hypothetical protein [Halomarina salina]